MPHEQIPAWTRDGRHPGSLTPLKGSKHRMTDAHLHAVNFVQETPGGEALIYYMDQANVAHAVIFGLPVAKLWAGWEREAPDYYLANDAPCYYYGYTDVIVAEMVRSLPPAQRDRLHPLLCGFNPVDRFAIRHVERLFAQYPGVWKGIGEVLLRHDDLTAFTYGETARANHPALWPVYQFAADHGLPVLLHQNVTSVTKSDHPVYLWELEEAVAEFPRTRFVFAHCGISRRVNVPFYHQMVERLLAQYPNLYVDYSWIIFDEIICPDRQPRPEWIALTEKHSDRICLGSDLVTRFERLGPELQRYDVFLDQLSAPARANLCQETAERLYGRNDRRDKQAINTMPEWESIVEHAR
ncbi:MAG: amidohydrolase family protein [Candidatus Sumerlaeota bacterium]|nr:amidohydrolase family protein [Candidatus Sumerlaeota bacterium]